MKMSNRTLVKTINGLLSFKNNGVNMKVREEETGQLKFA